VALDASRQMLDQAVVHLANVPAPVRFVQARLPHIPLAGWADVVFSTATFHWVRDHTALFSNIFTAIAPGGLLHAQCGGGRNLAEARRPAEDIMRLPEFSRWFRDFEGAWEFADDRVTAERLQAAGFTAIETSLEAAPVEFTDEASYRFFVATVVFRLHLARLPEALRPGFLDAIVDRIRRLPQGFTLDYWRLNLRARRPL
jgi:trans-aconitate 2-methyltransferase